MLQAVFKVMRFWLDMGVDGLRLDAIPYLVEREGTSNENLPETHAVLKQLRARLDARYPNRFLLAEANQWPEDVRDVLRRRRRVPHGVPLPADAAHVHGDRAGGPLPDRRDHAADAGHPGELPVGDLPAQPRRADARDGDRRERDYMYRMYAADPRARINLGIRRRLAPLMENDRDRIKLMNSLLLSMPGSPIIYYGDEIGMGDNIYLGDRNGVRTPMQWSPDRNAGFSRADPQRLYLPPIMDPIYGYEAVNVEAQQRDPSVAAELDAAACSRCARRSHAFGRGRLHASCGPATARSSPTCASTRTRPSCAWPTCRARRSRSSSTCARFKGRVPVELLGRTPFPPIGDLPYLLTLPGTASTGSASSRRRGARWHQEWLGTRRYRVLVLFDGWTSFFRARRSTVAHRAGQRRAQQLETRAAAALHRGQRWYAGRSGRGGGSQGDGAAAADRCRLGGGRPAELARARWRLRRRNLPRSQVVDRYFVPLALAWEDRRRSAPACPGPAVLAKVRQQARVGLLIDALADDAFCRCDRRGDRPAGDPSR